MNGRPNKRVSGPTEAGPLRVGTVSFVHYNTVAEIEQLIAVLDEVLGAMVR